ncbi:hypothetical protein QAD02_017264 [Eretmocerus hayati]|uniref:Uncharacterized protein n=1 Tax=Eretmocerus hayati TaxID=131215 RepID=A0ACC2PGA7_9HYME|nr:hypothetical protein QAD02_017264 [Eretmocerus hayati]
MGLKAAVQALRKAEPLKERVQQCKDLLNDNDAWMCQKQLQNIYQQVLILDLEYALDRKIEQELWNLGFKNYIALLQSQAKDRRNPKRSESQAMLSWCLEAANGFYLTLLQEICSAFDLDLPFRRKSYVYGCTSTWKAVEKLSAPHRSSCFYVCQYCLVHLGDIARYRNQNRQADLFYRHAIWLSPSSGQPYNQLALLEASRGDKVSTVFHYVRSVSVKHPFSAATANLAKTLSSALSDNSFSIDGKTKLSSQEYIAVFLKLHGVLYSCGDLSIAKTCVKLLNDTLTALVATESFNSWRLVQMLIINLYALQHAMPGITIENKDPMNIDQLSPDELMSRNCILDLIAGNLSALLLPVYTIKDAMVDYFALPAIKLCLDWIEQSPKILDDPAFASRLQIWPSLCVLLNNLQNYVSEIEYTQYSKVPLPEEMDLQGFLPLEKSLKNLNFTTVEYKKDIELLNKVRAMRILQIGKRMSLFKTNGVSYITLDLGNQNESPKFISANEGAGVSHKLMKELEELSLNKEKQIIISSSPSLSETASSKSSSEIDSLVAELGLEKRGGILKPQGSLERSRVDLDQVARGSDTSSLPSATRKPRQNVAMQAIIRRAETEQKQVTFKNVSPASISEENPALSSPALMKTAGTIIANLAPGNTTSNTKNMVSLPSPANVDHKMNSMMNAQSRPPLMPNIPFVLTARGAPGTLTLQYPQEPQSGQSSGESFKSSIEQKEVYNTQQSGVLSSARADSQFAPGEIQMSTDSQLTPNMSSYNQNSQPSQQQHRPTAIATNAPNYSIQALTSQSTQFATNSNISSSLLQYPVHTSPSQAPFQVNAGNTMVHQQMPQQQFQQTQQYHQNIPNSNVSCASRATNTISQLPITRNSSLPQQPTGQNIGFSTAQHHLDVLPQNMSPAVFPTVSAISLPNQANLTNLRIPTSFGPAHQSNISEIVPSGSNVRQRNPPGTLDFGQNNFVQLSPSTQKHIPPGNYSNSQQHSLQQPYFANPTNLIKSEQQHVNIYPAYYGYESKEYNPWKDQPPQPPLAWWGTGVSGGQLSQQSMHTGDNAIIGKSDGFQSWISAPNLANPSLSNLSVTHSNILSPTTSQGRMCNPGSKLEDCGPFGMDQKSSQPVAPAHMASTYSLFSNNSWNVNGQLASSITNMSPSSNQQDQLKSNLGQQSLWSGPGPSPLERLLEQQKSLREGGT